MRNKAILILIGFLVIIGLICFFWGNSIITRGLENTLQAIIGAKVEIEGFRLNPFKMAVQMESIQITNPANTWKNIIAANKVSFKLAPGPLFEGKKIIDEIILEELIFNDKRQTDGKLKKKVSPKPRKKNNPN